MITFCAVLVHCYELHIVVIILCIFYEEGVNLCDEFEQFHDPVTIHESVLTLI